MFNLLFNLFTNCLKILKLILKKFVCTESSIRKFLHKSKRKYHKETILLLFFTVFIMQLTKQPRGCDPKLSSRFSGIFRKIP